MTQLLAFEGDLRIGHCCARPRNACHIATEEDIAGWLEKRGYAVVADLLKSHTTDTEAKCEKP